MGNIVYGAIAFTGGTTGTLDKIPGAVLQDKDPAMVVANGSVWHYSYDIDSVLSESSPNVIKPDVGVGAWILQAITGVTLAGQAVGFTVSGGVTSRTLTVELDSYINQDLTTDAEPSFKSLLFTAANEVEISGGIITRTQGVHLVDTEADASYDVLTTIQGGSNGMLLLIRAANSARTVIVTDSGNLCTGGADVLLGDTDQYILFYYDGALSKWVMVGGIGGGGASPRGYRVGLTITIKDSTNLYVSGGNIEIGGNGYSSDTEITVATGALSASTLYYIYISAPPSGVITNTDFTLSVTAPAFDHEHGAYYMTGDSTKCLLGECYTDGTGALYLAGNPPTVHLFKDTDNVFNDKELLVYDATLGGFKGISASSPISVVATAIKLVNDAAAEVTQIDTGAMAASDTVVPTSQAVITYAVPKSMISTDGTMAENSDDNIPTEKAVVTYVDSYAVPKSLILGLIEGMQVTIKDATTLYVWGGFCEINGEIYQNVARLEIATGTLTADTLYGFYVDAAGSGHTLATGDFTLSTTAPTYDHAKGAYYMTGDGTKRWLANVHTA
jgi:hypothetical protein